MILYSLRHRLAADLHHLLTMPDYRYVDDGEIIGDRDEVRIAKDDVWHRVPGFVGDRAVEGFVRRFKTLTSAGEKHHE